VSHPSEIPAMIDSLTGIFKKLWPEYAMPQAMWILGSVTRAVLEQNLEGTLIEVRRILSGRALQRRYADMTRDPQLVIFWTAFLNFSDQNHNGTRWARLSTSSTGSSRVRISGRHSIPPPGTRTLVMRRLMDAGGILVLDLAKGLLGEDNARLLGALVATKAFHAALTRADIPESDRVDRFVRR
jgi:hypothetical protein